MTLADMLAIMLRSPKQSDVSECKDLDFWFPERVVFCPFRLRHRKELASLLCHVAALVLVECGAGFDQAPHPLRLGRRRWLGQCRF